MTPRSSPAIAWGGDIACTLLDLKAWVELGRYYGLKFEAALQLARYEKCADEALKDRAVACLEEALMAWKELSALWASHYMPYRMVRTKQLFGWPYYTEHVKRDIDIAKSAGKGGPDAHALL